MKSFEQYTYSLARYFLNCEAQILPIFRVQLHLIVILKRSSSKAPFAEVGKVIKKVVSRSSRKVEKTNRNGIGIVQL